jgi:hypothetical protein
MMYKQAKDKYGDVICVVRTTDNTAIPFAPDNTDYQAYLAWLEEGNTPLPADGE